MKIIHEIISCFECNWMCIFDNKLNEIVLIIKKIGVLNYQYIFMFKIYYTLFN